MPTTKEKEDIIKKFSQGKITVEYAMLKLSMSRASIYRLAKLMREGKSLRDARLDGNHRIYGKTK